MFGLEVLRSLVIIIGAQASKLGACDYGHKERAGGAAVVIEHNGKIISKDVNADLHTTEFFLRCAMKASKGRAPYDAHTHG